MGYNTTLSYTVCVRVCALKRKLPCLDKLFSTRTTFETNSLPCKGALTDEKKLLRFLRAAASLSGESPTFLYLPRWHSGTGAHHYQHDAHHTYTRTGSPITRESATEENVARKSRDFPTPTQNHWWKIPSGCCPTLTQK